MDFQLDDFITSDPSQINSKEQFTLIQEALKDHNKIICIYRERNEILSNLLKFWQKNDMVSVLNQIMTITNQNVLVDALGFTFAENP